jgi:CHASE3 domain sensor protein
LAEESAVPLTVEQRKANVRLALILATIAITLGVGFVVKVALVHAH